MLTVKSTEYKLLLKAFEEEAVRLPSRESTITSNQESWDKSTKIYSAFVHAANARLRTLYVIIDEAEKELLLSIKEAIPIIRDYENSILPESRFPKALLKKYKCTYNVLDKRVLTELYKKHNRTEYAATCIDNALLEVESALKKSQEHMPFNTLMNLFIDESPASVRDEILRLSAVARDALEKMTPTIAAYRWFLTKPLEAQNQELRTSTLATIHAYKDFLLCTSDKAIEDWEFAIHHVDGAFKEFLSLVKPKVQQ